MNCEFFQVEICIDACMYVFASQIYNLIKHSFLIHAFVTGHVAYSKVLWFVAGLSSEVGRLWVMQEYVFKAALH